MMESNLGSAAASNCAECNLVFPVDSMIRYKNVYVCANCKPVFMQKLAEGAQINTGEFRWAGFWIRFAAQFIDGLVVLPLSLGIQLITGMSFLQVIGFEQNRSLSTVIVAQLLGFATGVVYEVLLIGRYGATVGKMACGIKVVLPDGGKVSYLRALGRYFAKLLNTLTLYIGYIIAAFDDQKRGLHDRICNTRVIYK
jgi:uncharacterized RDD family membrane protein YckC